MGDRKVRATVKGRVRTSEDAGKSSGGWTKMNVTFEDHEGEIYTLSIPPDKTAEVSFDVGDNIELREGNFPNTWFWGSNLSKGSVPTGSNSRDNGKSTYQKNDGKNWDEINKYQMDVRDPKIEFQFYAGLIKDVYTTCLTNSPETDPEELVDRIINKTKGVVKSL